MSANSKSLNPSDTRLKSWIAPAILTLVLAAVAFIASPNAPLGTFWAPAPGIPQPSSAQLPLFILLNLAEALTFGMGVSFLIFGYPLVRAISPASVNLTRATHISIAWLLFNWWPHDSLHLHVGLELNGLLAIEYGFHVTLMLAGAIVAAFFLTILRQRATVER
ncbi:MAG: hypothetical protein HYZ49_11725 [Chloroflexi bacterium]|nr:hypothetical protein [Chloroflexota bacterium]